MLIVPPSPANFHAPDEAVAYPRQRGLRPAVWHDVTPNPQDNEIEAAFQPYAETGSDVITGLGGGSLPVAIWSSARRG